MVLSSWLTRHGDDVETAPGAGGLPADVWHAVEIGSLPSFHQAMPRLAHEISRARRYERPLTLALISAAGNLPSSVVTLLIAALLREALRETDIVTYSPSLALCVVGFPETPLAGARPAILRVKGVCLDRLGIALRTGVAQFPEGGWTLEELIRKAEANAEHDNVPALAASTEAGLERT